MRASERVADSQQSHVCLEEKLTCWLISRIAMSGRSVKSVKAASMVEVDVSGYVRGVA